MITEGNLEQILNEKEQKWEIKDGKLL